MAIAIMVQRNEQLKQGEAVPQMPEVKPLAAEKLAAFEQNAQAGAALSEQSKARAAKEAAAFEARMTPPAMKAVESTPAAPAPKKGLFSRIGGWFKSAFEPSVEERSAAHAQAEAAKNPLVAQQMKAMEDAAPIGKDEFKRMMKEGAASAKAEATRKAEQALKDQSAALGELGIVAHNEAFGAMGTARVAAESKVKKAAESKAAAAAKAELTAGLSGKAAQAALGRVSEKPKMTTDQQAAEKMVKAGDADLMEMIDAGEDPAEAAAFLAASRKEAGKAKRAAVIEKATSLATKAAKGVGEGAAYVRAQTKRGPTVSEAAAKVADFAANADIHGAGMKAVDAVLAAPGKAAKAVMEAKKASADRLVASQEALAQNRAADDAAAEFRAKLEQRRLADEGAAAFRAKQEKKNKPGYASTALFGIVKAGQYVREQTKRGPTVSEAAAKVADFAANADIHGAGMKAVDAVLSVPGKAAKGLDKSLAWTEKQMVGSGGLVEKAVQKTGRAGELAGKAADALLKAPVKGLEKSLELKDRAEKAAGAYLAKDWEATAQRMKARMAALREKQPSPRPEDGEPAWAKGDEDVPDEIAATVAEAAAERQEGPGNYVEVFEDLKDLAESQNRSRINAFLKEAEILEGIAAKGEDPNEHLAQIGDKFRGWKTADVQKLVKRLHNTNLLAK